MTMNGRKEMVPIYLRRCFPGWEQIKGKYVHPGMDGDIVLWIEKDAYVDAQDAQTIIDHLQERLIKVDVPRRGDPVIDLEELDSIFEDRRDEE